MVYNTRKRTREAVDTTDIPNPDTVVTNTVDPLTPGPAKCVKRAKQEKSTEKSLIPPARVRRKGSLQELPRMPLDIIDEILMHMRIGDLLSLSRTTKAFRELVWAHGAQRFWKAAMENSQADGLPACPDWLSIPAYANLMYSPHCHNCFTGNIQSVIYVWGVRYCKKCQEELLVHGNHVSYTARDCCSPFKIRHEKKSGRGTLIQETTYFLKTEISQFTQQNVSNVNWENQRRALVREKQKWSEKCRIWHECQWANRENEIQVIKNERLSVIISKLKELGWEEELNYMSPVTPHPLLGLKQVRQPRALTERIWLNMEDDAISFMKKKKTDRLRLIHYTHMEERYTILNEFWCGIEFDFRNSLPSCRDVVSFPAIKAIMDLPDDVVVTDDNFQLIKDNIMEYVAEYKQIQNAMLREWIEDQTDLQLSKDVDILDLAIASHIKCSCSSTSCNPLAHDCGDSYRYRSRNKIKIDWSAEPDDFYERALDKIAGYPCWSPAGFESPWWILKYLIKCAGEDPALVTADEMSRKDIRWYCASCDSENVRTIMSWRAVTRHIDLRHDHYYSSDTYKKEIPIAKVADSKQIAHLEMAALGEAQERNKLYVCMRCPDNVHISFPSQYTGEAHLKNWHKIERLRATDLRIEDGPIRQLDPFYIIVKPTGGSRPGRIYAQAKHYLDGYDVRTVFGKLS